MLYDVIQFPLEIAGGRVVLDYTDATGAHRTLQSGEIKNAWWDAISYIPQAAMSVLNRFTGLTSSSLSCFAGIARGAAKRP